VLAADQQPLSDLFATQGADKFSGQNLSRGPGNLPLLMDCAARFECRTAFQYEGGDHEILVGEVENFVDNQRSPLVFTGGQYAVAVDKPRETVDEPQPIRPNGSFGKDYLGFLLSVAHHQLRSQLRPKLEDLGITDDDYTVLMTLLVRDDRHEDELSGLMKYMGRGSPENMFVRLQAKRLITYDQNRSSVLLTRAGRRTAVEIIAMTKAIESDAETNLDYGERELLKRLLRRIIRNTDPGTYRFWRADHA
jgi:3-hydroxy-9,10-secoandrosta-1,3,5(10)-triene-9,17-dione monooxygenase reductase component